MFFSINIYVFSIPVNMILPSNLPSILLPDDGASVGGTAVAGVPGSIPRKAVFADSTQRTRVAFCAPEKREKSHQPFNASFYFMLRRQYTVLQYWITVLGDSIGWGVREVGLCWLCFWTHRSTQLPVDAQLLL